MSEIYLAGGCFWGVEEYFSRIPGVTATEVGYANGHTDNPTYQQVCTDTTGFAETVHVTYDPSLVSLETMLDQYFMIIDPLSHNQQGNDRGTQYRTGVYYVDEDAHGVAARVFARQQEHYRLPASTPLRSITRTTSRRTPADTATSPSKALTASPSSALGACPLLAPRKLTE